MMKGVMGFLADRDANTTLLPERDNATCIKRVIFVALYSFDLYSLLKKRHIGT